MEPVRDARNPSTDVEVVLLKRSKANPTEHFPEVLKHIGQSFEGTNIGTFKKDLKRSIGTFAEEWMKTVNANNDVQFAEGRRRGHRGSPCRQGDEGNRKYYKRGQAIGSHHEKVCRAILEEIVDYEESCVKHVKLAEDIENALQEPANAR